MRVGTTLVGLLTLALVLFGSSAEAARQPPSTEMLSAKPGRIDAGGVLGSIAVSRHGRYVVFTSYARLAPGDPSHGADLYLRDRVDGRFELAGVGGAYPAISASGRYVAFIAYDTADLVSGDTNLAEDVFVRDRVAHTTQRVSVTNDGGQSSLYGGSGSASISADGRYVAFSSQASNLVAGDTNQQYDVFVRDRVAKTTTRVSVSNHGKQQVGNCEGPTAISADGRYVVFGSMARNLVAGDTNHARDIFVRDVVAGTTERVDVSSAGEQPTYPGADLSQFAISANGRYVTFSSGASNLVEGDTNGAEDIFVRDLVAGTTTRVSVSSTGVQADLGSLDPTISDNGRYVAFISNATNLVPGDANTYRGVFRRDLLKGTTEQIDVAWDGSHANGRAGWTAISGDGHHVAFVSDATNLVPTGDPNPSYSDVFIRNLD